MFYLVKSIDFPANMYIQLKYRWFLESMITLLHLESSCSFILVLIMPKVSYLWKFSDQSSKNASFQWWSTVFADDFFTLDSLEAIVNNQNWSSTSSMKFVWNFSCERLSWLMQSFPKQWSLALWYHENTSYFYFSPKVTKASHAPKAIFNTASNKNSTKSLYIDTFTSYEETQWVRLDNDHVICSSDIRLQWFLHNWWEMITYIWDIPTSIAIKKHHADDYRLIRDRNDIDLITLNLYNHSLGKYVFFVFDRTIKRTRWRNKVSFMFESWI